jgi:hypothetical protein
MTELLWSYIDGWRTEPGPIYRGKGDEVRPGRFSRGGQQKEQRLSKVTVTFNVPPLRAQACNAFLRQAQKEAGAAPGDDAGLPSDLDLIHVAADHAIMVEALEWIGHMNSHLGPAKELQERARLTLERLQSKAGAQVLETMRQQREAVREKSVDVAAELIKRVDVYDS